MWTMRGATMFAGLGGQMRSLRPGLLTSVKIAAAVGTASV
jgi:hypothetical protein